jgi:hypothetical protein
MKSSLFGLLTLYACAFAAGAFAEETIVDKSTNISFPREVSFDFNGKHFQLEATGVATRKKFIVKVYSIASYLQKGAAGDKLQAILSDDNAKQLTMKWARDATASQIQDAYKESFQKVFGSQYAMVQNDIDSFIQLFNKGAVKGDEFVLRWIPGGDVEVLINGTKVGSMANPAFAKGLWLVWFGDKSPVDKNELLK